jgi:hypothetical protein
MTISERCSYYALGIPVFRTVAFTIGFISQAVLAVAIFEVI